jgi:ribonucleoside-diphosphate reductase alpha chain
MIHNVIKRNGDVVQFSAQKVADAIDRCYGAAGDVAPQQAASMVVQLLRGRFGGDAPTVEQVQNAVESVLLSLGERDAAKRYMAYRDERANARRMSAVTPHLRSVYEAGAASMGGEPLRVFQYFDKYARHRDDLEGGPRRETWPECVDRAMDHLRWLVIRECGEDKVTPEEWDFLRRSVVDCDSMPSMRLLSQAGPAARRDDVAIFNCSYQAITDLLCFKESLLISMAGAGDAYSVEQKFITNLPFVRHQRGGKPEAYIIDDSSEGWANALLHGIERWYDGADVVFDYSELRLAGAILKTKGGRSSGPGPLRKVLNGVRALILSRQGSQLRPVDVNDLLCLTGEAGNSGGVRRTAKLSLSDWNDSDMQAAKSAHGWWDTHPHRSNANNSAVWPEGGPSQLELMGQMHSMFLGASGERGIFSRENALRTMPKRREEYLRANGGAFNLGTNSCGEIYLQNRSFCNLTQAVARPKDTLDTLRRKVRAATILGTIQSLATNYPHLRTDWGQHGREERLLGVDITGQMDCELLRRGDRDSEITLAHLRDYARSVNETYAARFGIAASMAITCNKPSGNSSALLNCAPGINARKIRYGIRNARVSASSPVFKVLQVCGVPMDPENGQNVDTATTWVVHFPMRAPEGSVVESERSAVQQLNHWILNKRHWTEHNPSVTITYSPDEMIDVVSWVWKHREEIGGISFLPRSNSVYRQMPYEETSKAEYETALAAFPAIDWAMIAAYEREDTTTSSRELACGANGCETA